MRVAVISACIFYLKGVKSRFLETSTYLYALILSKIFLSCDIRYLNHKCNLTSNTRLFLTNYNSDKTCNISKTSYKPSVTHL